MSRPPRCATWPGRGTFTSSRRRSSGSNPAARLFEHDLPHRRDPGRMIIQAPAGMEYLAARRLEVGRRLVADLVERLQAIDREARQHYEDLLRATLREILKHVVGVGLQPFAAAKARLVGLRPAALGKLQTLLEGLRRVGDLGRVGVAPVGIL